MTRHIIITVLLLSACRSAAPPPAPWANAPIENVPAVYRTEWQRAENRTTCALIAFAGTPENATPRRANFSGGWAVAYDTPSQRSAFGIAGTGTSATGTTYEWPNSKTWSDGSTATWGLEGGTGPNHLAYIRIAGQGCLYNVWSARGEDHLEGLIEQIRYVR